MTFTDLVTEVADRLNLTSTNATTRIGRSVNAVYRELASGLGIKQIERSVVTATTVIGNRYLSFNCEKILSVFNTIYSPPLVMAEAGFEELRDGIIDNDPPGQYAIANVTASTVTVFLSSIPASNYVLNADAMVNLPTLSGTQIPAFAEDFHDILVYGAMEIELDKLEKSAMAKRFGDKKEKRMSELRYYMACSAYRADYPGKDAPIDATTFLPVATD